MPRVQGSELATFLELWQLTRPSLSGVADGSGLGEGAACLATGSVRAGVVVVRCREFCGWCWEDMGCKFGS